MSTSHIFINYRRDDSGHAADRIYDRLCRKFKEDAIFIDVEGIPPGIKWEEHLRQKVNECRVMLVIIGWRWLNALDPKTGERRLDQPNDFVRYEIEVAIDRNIPIYPLFLDGLSASDIPESQLPKSIKDLKEWQGLPIRRTPYFDTDIDYLIECIDKLDGLETIRAEQSTSNSPQNPKKVANNYRPTFLSRISRQLDSITNRFLSIQQTEEVQIYGEIEPRPGDRWIDPNGETMVFVPTGRFLMGSTDEEALQDYEHIEKDCGVGGSDRIQFQIPQHEQYISQSFYLDLNLVTNESYERFVNDGGYDNSDYWTQTGWAWVKRNNRYRPRDYPGYMQANSPRVGVTWYEAFAYCQWRGGRLANEAEWEWASRGPENLPYPWGHTFRTHGWLYQTLPGFETLPVTNNLRREASSWLGIHDLSGNVWEWVNSEFRTYPYSQHDGRENQDSGWRPRVLRGGAWWGIPRVTLRTVHRRFAYSDKANMLIGFRCARTYMKH
ncbi:MAG: SUMF1/EgtB/PvdO family nonheme iron enzyme [Anaerolineae bacterium]|nr:SUMF1/EgtB/PvdO family nonheme iron enzyme [Anaerolineae bacterium]